LAAGQPIQLAVKKTVLLPPLFLLLSCVPESTYISISFSVAWHGQPFHCDAPADGVSLSDARFYVSRLVAHGTGGDEWPVTLEADGAWQNESVGLIDLESGEGDCLNGSSAVNGSIRGRYAGGDISGVSFDLGVPESMNHSDPMTAGVPLSYTEMHWHWASGYKFLRAGVATDTDSVFLHLGSSRCEGTIGDIQGCRSANRPRVMLADFDPDRDRVVIDFGVLFDSVDLSNRAPSSCMSGPAEGECTPMFDALGLEFESGDRIADPRAIAGVPAQ
jgi:uncharacterized repeat protein (TIGR04052 family)